MTAAIVLAAGAATRMGRLKQLLPFHGETLVRHTVHQAFQAEFSPVVLVIGAQADAVQGAVAELPVEVVVNENWEHGMGSSVLSGMMRLQQIAPDAEAVAILLADQPLITASHLMEMRALLLAGTALAIAAEYSDTVGVPALFKHEVFPLLASLPPEAGAKRLLRDSRLSIATYPLPEAGIDIDTPEDFAALQRTTA